MENVNRSLFNVPQSLYLVSVYSACAMILFFLFMKLIGLVTIVEFRFVNFVILFFGVRTMLLRLRKANNGKLEYLSGMLAGLMTAFFTCIFFTAFICIYLFIDSGFMNYLKISQPFGSYLTPFSVGLVIFIEGIASGIIIDFALMHLLNMDENQG